MTMKIVGSIHPPSVADMWMRARPKGDDRTNQMEMWTLVGLLSDRTTNQTIMVAPSLAPRGGNLYDKKICGGLLTCYEEKGNNRALATVVSDPSKTRFELRVAGPQNGPFDAVLIIAPTALTYKVEDQAMLFGFVQHELRHFMDFMDHNWKPVKDLEYTRVIPGGYEIDIDLYTRNITEMRAHADQATAIIRIMGSAENAKKAIADSRLASGMIPEIRESMMLFIDLLAKEASISEMVEPPAVVVRSEDHDVRKLVSHLERMFEVMRFSNNIRPKNR